MADARLYARQRTAATELQRSMLPDIPDVPGWTVVSRYLPAATGVEVGGDWVDVIRLPAGRTAFVVGDVMGRGGSRRRDHGADPYRGALLRPAGPATGRRHVPSDDLTRGIRNAHLITCLSAVHDPAEHTLTYTSAGHLPPAVITADGRVELLSGRLGLPLGVGDSYRQRQVPFPPGNGCSSTPTAWSKTGNGYSTMGWPSWRPSCAPWPPPTTRTPPATSSSPS